MPSQANDFGGEIIPWAANDGYKVQAYLFNDYWEDIGTIKSFFEANLALAAQVATHSDGTCRLSIWSGSNIAGSCLQHVIGSTGLTV